MFHSHIFYLILLKIISFVKIYELVIPSPKPILLIYYYRPTFDALTSAPLSNKIFENSASLASTTKMNRIPRTNFLPLKHITLVFFSPIKLLYTHVNKYEAIHNLLITSLALVFIS